MTESTEAIRNKINKAENWEELTAIMDSYEDKKFGDRLYELCENRDKKFKDVMADIAVSQSMLYDVLNNKKIPSKETVIKIAFGIGLSEAELNELLKLANHKELYAKNKEDAIIIFGLKNKKDIYDIDKMLETNGFKMKLVDR